MTTTRVRGYLSEKKPILKKVEPTNTLLLGPCPCEKKAASFRDTVNDHMGKNDIAMVAYRYLENELYENATWKEASNFALLSLMPIACLIVNEFAINSILLRFISLVAIFGGFAHVAPNVANSYRYAETKTSCKGWLKETKHGTEIVPLLESLKFNLNDVTILGSKLEALEIDTTNLKPRMK